MNRTFASFAPYALYCPIRPERADAPSPGRAASGASLPKQEYDDFERHIEENDFGIGIL